MKYVIILVVIWAVVVWFKKLKKTANKQFKEQRLQQHNPFASRKKQDQPEQMVQCAHCGVHFPASEAVTDISGQIYCSEEHRQLDKH